MKFIERKYSAEYSISLINEYAKSKSWHFAVSTLGKSNTTSKCIIKNNNGDILSVGYGKGLGKTSEVGSIYESVEHYFSSFDAISENINYLKTDFLEFDETIKNTPYYCEIVRQKGKTLGCLPYKRMFSEEINYVPVFLSFVDYTNKIHLHDNLDYKKLLKEGTNSGISIANSYEEACIHSISELIERDALSIFLADHFLGDKKFGKIINLDSLPDDLKNIIDIILSKSLLKNILLIDITTDIDVPSFCAVSEDDLYAENPSPIGSGTSLSPIYAAYRALWELLQYHEVRLTSHLVSKAEKSALLAVKSYKKFVDCVNFNVDESIIPKINWNYPDVFLDINSILEKLYSKIDAVGGEVFCYEIHSEPSLFSVVSCHCPILDRFNLVRMGAVILPGQRAMSYMK
ncbi:YcaO-like family protein [Brytella acorum]|uniref:YcaO-like family protein n=1 Tax=Brytella acorum TaxID=2959299 RepID=UPI0025ADFEA8|nr:YcaO-like family protein [Brytella acorum]MDF3626196.1 YcaO-like family protein [Brytella acorum]